jgi:cytidylate kinase
MLAGRIHCLYVDTGAHYRAITHILQQGNIPHADAARIIQKLASLKIDEELEGNAAHILLNRKRFDDSQLRAAMVNSEVADYAAVMAVRKFLLHFQRSQAEVATLNGFAGIVMEGRDIGTNIFPDTPFKYFFIADKNVKTARRAQEGIADGPDERDRIDATLGQLREAADATEVDTTNRSLDEVVDWLWKDVNKKLETLKR